MAQHPLAVSARRLLTSPPPGPLWLYIVVVLFGTLLIGLVNYSFASQGNVLWGAFLTLVFAVGFYGLSLAMMQARFGAKSRETAAPHQDQG